MREHVEQVRLLATKMAAIAKTNGHQVDELLVETGAILHDVGRSQTQDPTHAYLGAQWLAARNVPEKLVRIVARHTGAGLVSEEAAALGLPSEDFVPETLEEKIVAHADNLVSGPRRINLEFLQKKYAAQGLHSAFAKIELLHAQLAEVLGCDPQDVTSAK